jgi:ankyrin repeat protein
MSRTDRRHDAAALGDRSRRSRDAQLLVRAGANVKAANRYGVTPMYSAAVNGNAAMIELLLKAAPIPTRAEPKARRR